MDNKELNEILQKYAESTRSDPSIAFKKLNEKSSEVKSAKKKFKWQYMLASVASAIVIVLCVVLPITLTNTSQNNEPNNEPTYCYAEDLVFNEQGNISVLINDYGISAYYPTYGTDLGISAYLITLRNDSSFKGVEIDVFVFEDIVAEVSIAIIPKTYILQTYEEYFTLPNQEQWREYAIKFNNTFNSKTGLYDMKIYFTDGNYDYFVSGSCDEELNASELLNILYE